ncbi:Hypothetical_protein [Hexamita inflata]|uniref:Hypothetical_protein n=1 Tax=Hexamita inflata TaxID=28002 RepID=A0AA86R0H1_9EUKA|nr:Hypothetical protein HINF_LOCUS57049 [Hexamita inflata]
MLTQQTLNEILSDKVLNFTDLYFSNESVEAYWSNQCQKIRILMILSDETFKCIYELYKQWFRQKLKKLVYLFFKNASLSYTRYLRKFEDSDKIKCINIKTNQQITLKYHNIVNC